MPLSTSPRLDVGDRALLTALAADGRASWAVVGAASGCSASTAQRRYNRLRQAGLVRVIGTVDVLAVGFGVSVLLRVQCGAAGVDAATTTLAELPDVRFVTSTTGSADCVAELVLESFGDLQPLLDRLPAGVGWRTEALPVLRTFTVPFESFPGAEASEGPDRAVSLTSGSRETGVIPTGRPLTAEQRTIIELLIADGRTPLVEIARAVGRSEAATRRAIDRLTSSGRIRIGPLIAPMALGLETELMVWIAVAPDLVGSAARQLAAHPAVHYASVTAGRFNLVGQAFLTNFAAAYDFSTDVLGALPGVREVDISVQMTTHKRMWTRLHRGRFCGAEPTEEESA